MELETLVMELETLPPSPFHGHCVFRGFGAAVRWFALRRVLPLPQKWVPSALERAGKNDNKAASKPARSCPSGTRFAVFRYAGVSPTWVLPLRNVTPRQAQRPYVGQPSHSWWLRRQARSLRLSMLNMIAIMIVALCHTTGSSVAAIGVATSDSTSIDSGGMVGDGEEELLNASHLELALEIADRVDGHQRAGFPKPFGKGAWLGVDGLDLINRCWWLYVRGKLVDVEGQLRIRCKGMLLLAYGVNLVGNSQEEKHSQCMYFADLGLPTHSWVWDLLFYRKFFEADYMSTRFWPPLMQRSGGVVVNVGSLNEAVFAARMVLPWRPRMLHLFEPIPDFIGDLRKNWARKYRNVSIHAYGLTGGETRFDVPLYEAGGSSSTYHHLHFSSNRMYMEPSLPPSDANFGPRGRDVHAGHPLDVTLRSVTDTWRKLGLDDVTFMFINCEGCEYHVLPALSEAGLLTTVDRLLVQFHPVLDVDEAVAAVESGKCNWAENWCHFDAVVPALKRFCQLVEILERTHHRTFGLPFNSYMLFELGPPEHKVT
eukprot:TRINITY_DN35060_c0_g1_i1.p1 TRINITY_DN35060_c0_g1~~TRINITY_DN35060_c0_g1_i1.p1  ORF type:complete len:541 (+),score=58.85 TRINITY_DN35060_c0_g1_i1:21-1643(+)